MVTRLSSVAAMGVFGLLVSNACSSSDSGTSRPRAEADASTGGNGSGGRSGSGGKTGGAGGSTSTDCSRFAFEASGTSCDTTGCSSLTCSCGGGFPKSVAKCTTDGCLVGADCAKLCAEDLSAALDCVGTYTVRQPGTGGTTGTGGDTGAGGKPPVLCTAEDVHVPAASAKDLGTNVLERPRMLGDETGAVYIGGAALSDQTVNVGGADLPSGAGNLVLMKLDANHQHVWSHRFGSELGIERVTAMNFARNGDVLITGYTGRTVDLGGGAAPAVTPPQLYVARYGRDGTFIQGYLTVAPASGDVPIPSAVVDTPSDDVLVFGQFRSSWDILGKTLTPSGEQDLYVLRFGSTGTLLEVKQFGRSGNDLALDAVADTAGNFYLLGFAYVAIDFGKNAIDLGTDQYSSYVVKLDSNLQPVWQKRVGNGAYPRRAILDGTTLIVAGDTTTGAYYGDATSGNLPNGTLFVLRIDTAIGSLIRGDQYAKENAGVRVTALAKMPNGGVAVGGYASPPVDLGGGQLTSVPGYQPFFARYDASGGTLQSTILCTTNLAGGADGAIGGIASDGDSAVFVAPYYDVLNVGSKQFTGSYGSAFVDMPALPATDAGSP